MIKIILAVAILAAAVFFGPRLADNQGFVHIATEQYIVESSLTTAIVVVLVAFLILHLLINLISSSARIPSSTLRWLSNRKERKHLNLQSEAFLAYEEGAFKRTLGLIKKCGQTESLPAHCLFLGAKASFKLGQYDTCRNFLDIAEKAPNNSELACKLLRAKLNLKLGNTQAALENLHGLGHDNYSQGMVNKLLIECYEQMGDYQKINELLPSLKKQKVLKGQEISSLQVKCLKDNLNKANSAQEVKDIMNGLSRAERHDPIVMGPILTRLVDLGDEAYASVHTTSLLRHHNEPQLLIEISKWSQGSSTVLSELSNIVDNQTLNEDIIPPLLMALANLEMHAGYLESAKKHLDEALKNCNSKDIYLLAARLNEKLANEEEAHKYLTLALKQ